MERASTIQTASVITQPTDATEHLTLIEKLEQEVKRLLELKSKEKPHSLGYVFLGHHIAATVNAINIVKQHQVESDWISADERFPNDWSVVLCYGVPFEWDKTSKTNSNIFCAVYVAEHDRWSVGYSAFGDTSTQKVTHWIPLPKPPSEVKGEAM